MITNAQTIINKWYRFNISLGPKDNVQIIGKVLEVFTLGQSTFLRISYKKPMQGKIENSERADFFNVENIDIFSEVVEPSLKVGSFVRVKGKILSSSRLVRDKIEEENEEDRSLSNNEIDPVMPEAIAEPLYALEAEIEDSEDVDDSADMPPVPLKRKRQHVVDTTDENF